MQSLFSEFIEELSEAIDFPLHLDPLNTCTLSIDNDFTIHIEEGEENHLVFIGSFISEISPGKYRDKVFRECLKENSHLDATSIFAFNSLNSSLCLFTTLDTNRLDMEACTIKISEFIEKVSLWKKAIETNDIASIHSNFKEKTYDNPFGIKL
ncbi:MAG TPA: CesT family type III secretion system chaperone [Chlamydiales bacterium]|nr:CesT family type III secretion system chaperone [Chlamydiales bacterium]